MAKLFISHVHEEAEIANAVLKFLKVFKLDAFLSSDQWQVRAGERWFDRIATELSEATLVILLLSKYSVTRPWINFEAGWAWGKDKVAIPLCYGGLMKGAMPRPYSDLQGLELRTDYYDLVKDCYLYLNNLGELAPPVPFQGNEPAAKELLDALTTFEKRQVGRKRRAPGSTRSGSE